jgi:hypothetical protein
MIKISGDNMMRILELAGVEVKGVDDDNKKDMLVSLLHKNDKPSDADLGAFDKTFIASMLAGFLKKYKHEQDKDENFDEVQLAKGVKIEKEHTDDPYIAKIIAKAHLAEIPDYYDRLEKMEKEAEASNSETERKDDAGTDA